MWPLASESETLADSEFAQNGFFGHVWHYVTNFV